MRNWVVLVVLSMAASGCATGEPSDAVMTALPPETTTTPVATTTTVPTSEPWDLAYFSDSGGWGVAERYAELATEALGRRVRVHDHATGGLQAVDLLGRIEGILAEEVAAAEIIVVYGNPEDSGVDLPQPDIGTCVSTSALEREAPALASVDDWQPYRDLLQHIYDEIWQLRDGKPTVLRAVDLYSPVISAWREAGIEPECTANWELWSQVIREAAEANGATMVSIYDLFNGPAHDEDPRERGLIGPDGQHTSPEGAALIAEAIHTVGYEPSAGPG